MRHPFSSNALQAIKAKGCSFDPVQHNNPTPANIPPMKKWRQFFQSLFIKPIVGTDPATVPARRQEVTADLEMIRFSVWQTLRSVNKAGSLLLEYSTAYAPIMDELRMEGWGVTLEIGEDGELVYMISADRSGMIV
jgi:hypothetical protein